MKKTRLIVLICLVFASLIIIVFPWFGGGEGVVVTSVEANSACKDVISIGSTIREIAGRPIENSNDFIQVTKNLKGSITLIANNNPRSCIIPENSTLDVSVRDIKPKSLRFGIDVADGLFYLYKPEKNISVTNLRNILNLLEFRVKKYDLINTQVLIENDSIRILTDSEEEEYINYLVERGSLEGKFMLIIEMLDDRGEFTFNEKTYEVFLKNGLVEINDYNYETGQYFILDGIKFLVENVSLNTTKLSMIVFEDKDLSAAESGFGTKYTRITKQGNNYVFIINTQLSEEARNNFANATRGQEITISSTGESFLRDPLIIEIDGNSIVDLPIRGIDVGGEIDELIIWGFRTSSKEATIDMLRLSTVIEKKRLPTDLILSETGVFTSISGNFLINLPFYSLLIVSIATSILFLIRYKKRSMIVLPLILTIIGEMLLILGIISLPWFFILVFLLGIAISLAKNEIHGWFGWLTIFLMLIMTIAIAMSDWVLNTSTIIGLSVFPLLSSSLGFIILNGVLTGEKTFSQNEYKRSSKKIWLSSFIIILLLFPLFFVGDIFSGITMIIFVGLFICITITKPICYSMIEKIIK